MDARDARPPTLYPSTPRSVSHRPILCPRSPCGRVPFPSSPRPSDARDIVGLPRSAIHELTALFSGIS
jgi:hypothetical protein